MMFWIWSLVPNYTPTIWLLSWRYVFTFKIWKFQLEVFFVIHIALLDVTYIPFFCIFHNINEISVLRKMPSLIGPFCCIHCWNTEEDLIHLLWACSIWCLFFDEFGFQFARQRLHRDDQRFPSPSALWREREILLASMDLCCFVGREIIVSLEGPRESIVMFGPLSGSMFPLDVDY